MRVFGMPGIPARLMAAAALAGIGGLAVVALSTPTEAGGGGGTDLVSISLEYVCPSSISLGGGGFPVRCGSYYSEAFSQGDKRGHTLTMRGPWTIVCGNNRPSFPLPDISFQVGPEENIIKPIGRYANPCNPSFPLQVTSQQVSAPYGVGRNFVFKIYFAG